MCANSLSGTENEHSALNLLFYKSRNQLNTLTNTFQNLNNIIDELRANGVEPKVTKLPTKKARKADLVFTSGHRTTGVRVAGSNFAAAMVTMQGAKLVD